MMIWIFMLVILLALVMVKLGAMSVWVTVLVGALQAMLLAAGAVMATLVWRYWKRR